MSVHKAIRKANAVLPGETVEERHDPRWQAIIAVGEYVVSDPEAVWVFIHKWGGHEQEDLRMAIATCLLEHQLEYHFDAYFPKVQQAALADPLFADTVRCCWRFGQAKEPANSARLDALEKQLSRRVRRRSDANQGSDS
jgi:hypothetical protein